MGITALVGLSGCVGYRVLIITRLLVISGNYIYPPIFMIATESAWYVEWGREVDDSPLSWAPHFISQSTMTSITGRHTHQTRHCAARPAKLMRGKIPDIFTYRVIIITR